MMCERLSARCTRRSAGEHVPFTINTAPDRTRRRAKLANIFLAAVFVVDVDLFAACAEVVTAAASAFLVDAIARRRGR